MVSPASDAPAGRVELLERLGVPAWHAQGWKGQGLKVAVLDSGFHGYKAYLGTALPRSVETRSFRFDGNLEAKDSQHGILCAEVIHALAPDAELLFANWEPEHPDQFLAAVRWARQQGARVLSCSIIMPTWSDCEGHGRIHEELARLLGPNSLRQKSEIRNPKSEGKSNIKDRNPKQSERAVLDFDDLSLDLSSDFGFRISDFPPEDALFIASAGNTAQRHWSGPFEDDGSGYHAWRDTEGVAHRENVIHPWGGERVSVELCCPSSTNYEVTVSDAATEKIVGRSPSTNGGGGSAVVAFTPEPGRDYQVRVRRLSDNRSEFHLVVLGGGLYHTSSAGSIPFPGDGPEVIAVGAIDAAGRRLAYSSCGPKRGAAKPDLVATVPFPSRWRARPFTGTSAAAPQAGALAALLWSRHPDWNAKQIRAALQNAARPCPANSPTWETGHGWLQLPSPN